MIVEETISLGELLSVDPSEFVGYRHDQATTVRRVSIPGLELDVLNLFPPRRKAFWSFGIFEAQFRRTRTFVDIVRSDVIRYIDVEHERLGINKKSVNAYEFLGPFTKTEGLAYYPYSTEGSALPYWWFAQRHIVCVCPVTKTSLFLEYFAKQEMQIGEGCYIDASEDFVFVDESQYENTPEYISLSRYVGSLSKAERALAAATLLEDGFLESANQAVLQVIGRSVGPSVALLEKLTEYDDAERVRAILCARVKLAPNFSTLLCVEQMQDALGEFWHVSDRNIMLQVIENHLNKYPVIKSIVA